MPDVARTLVGIVIYLSLLFSSDSFAIAETCNSSDLREAWADIDKGAPQRAYQIFNCVEASSTAYVSEARVESLKGLMISASLADDGRKASHWWKEIVRIAGPEPTADRLVFKGDFKRAFVEFRNSTSDEAIVDPRSGQPDRVIAAGVDAELHGDISGAINAWSVPAVGAGPNDLTDLQEALIGIARSQRGQWTEAAKIWITAARKTRVIPMAEFETGNLVALSMLYHYRSTIRMSLHSPRRG